MSQLEESQLNATTIKNISTGVSKLCSELQEVQSEGMKAIIADINSLDEIARSYIKRIEELKLRWNEVAKEVETLEKKKLSYDDQIKDFEAKVASINKQQQSLTDLHKALDNRKTMLDEEEKRLDAKALQLQDRERIASLKRA